MTRGGDSDEDEEVEAPPTPLEDRKLKVSETIQYATQG